MSTILRRAALAAAVTLPVAFTAIPAHADSNLNICNSSISYSWIEVWDTGTGKTLRWLPPDGGCAGFSGAASIRVNVNTYGSYKLAVAPGGAWSPCYEGPNGSSNPPDAGAYKKVWYRTSKLNCDGSTPVVPKP